MRGQKRPFGEPYETGDGVELMYPHDPNAPIEETAGCHCTESTRLAL
jgi:hypothetical protein